MISETPTVGGGGGRDAPARIAVVAVHGVADQQPYQTARKCANILASYHGSDDDNGDPPYEAAIERHLRIPVDEIQLKRKSDTTPQARSSLSFQARAILSDLNEKKADDGDAERAHAVMQEQFAELELPLGDRVYETIRLETRRREKDATCDVHVYEMYWADLSRLGNRAIGVVLDFFQLLFLLAGEGARTLGYTRAALVQREQHNFWWRAFGDTHALATRLLVLGFPALTLAFLGLLSAVIPFAVQELDSSYAEKIAGDGSIIAMIPAVVVAAALGIAALFSFRLRWPARQWWIALAVIAATAFAVWAAVAFKMQEHAYLIAVVTLWLAFLVGLAAVMVVYERRFCGALYWASAVATVITVAGVIVARSFRGWSFNEARTHFEVAETVAEIAIRWLHWPLWTLFAALCLFASGFALLATRRTAPDARSAAARTAWTAMFTLSFSGIATFMVSLALWSGLPIALGAFPCQWAKAGSVVATQSALGWLMKIALPPHWSLPLLLLVLVAALLIAVWSIAPAALADTTLNRARPYPCLASWLGTNLTSAFTSLRVCGEMVRWTVAVGLVATAASFWILSDPPRPEVVQYLAVIGGAFFFIAVAGSHGPFRFLLLGFRAVLDVALDVVNWLRLDPATKTPAGRISSRYYSLLRYLSSWRADDGSGYDAIVVFAHSQGTVITADLLRFIKREWAGCEPPGLGQGAGGRLPILFLTIGCPLRQLYARRFPHRYDWAQDTTRGWDKSTACRPADLGVEVWSNAYRSGDYIGRFLWHREDQDSVVPWDQDMKNESEDRSRRERCIGFGGHGSYWGEIAPEIAAELDGLIHRACSDRKAASAETAT